MGVIAAQLGHSGTRMTEKHYAHLAPSYVADTVRASLPPLANFEPNNVGPNSGSAVIGLSCSRFARIMYGPRCFPSPPIACEESL